jgi:hypothetical protein
MELSSKRLSILAGMKSRRTERTGARKGARKGSKVQSAIKILRAGKADAALAREAVHEIHGRRACDEAALRVFLGDPERYLLLALEDGGW